MRFASVAAAVLTALYGKPASAADDTVQGDALEEVVVTASRRAMRCRICQSHITAVTGQALEAAGIEDIAGLAHAVAGVNYTDKGPFARGQWQHVDYPRLDSEATGGPVGTRLSGCAARGNVYRRDAAVRQSTSH